MSAPSTWTAAAPVALLQTWQPENRALAQRLASFRPLAYRESQHARSSGRVLKEAAVLIALFENPATKLVEVHLTVRSVHLRVHAGEVALPGGKRDPEDLDEVATALREAREEVGLASGDIHIIGALPQFIARNGILVFPVVGVVSAEWQPKPNASEVSDCFSTPLEVFLAPFTSATSAPFSFSSPLEASPFVSSSSPSLSSSTSRRQREAATANSSCHQEEAEGRSRGQEQADSALWRRADVTHEFMDTIWVDHAVRVHTFRHNDRVIWGLTARILICLVTVAHGTRPPFQIYADGEPLPYFEEQLEQIQRKRVDSKL